VKAEVIQCTADLTPQDFLDLLCPQGADAESPAVATTSTWSAFNAPSSLRVSPSGFNPDSLDPMRLTTTLLSSMSVSSDLANVAEDPETNGRRASLHEPKVTRQAEPAKGGTSLSRARSHGSSDKRRTKKLAKGPYPAFEAVIIQDFHVVSVEVQALLREFMNRRVLLFGGREYSVPNNMMIVGVLPEELFAAREIKVIPNLVLILFQPLSRGQPLFNFIFCH